MLINLLILVLILALAIFFGWLARRAWGTRNGFVRWIGTLLAGLLMLVLALVAIVGGLGAFKYYTPKSHAVQDLQVAGTPEQIERGQHLAGAFCVECHSTTADFPMTGGVDLGNDLPVNLGQYVSGNLTPAGPLKDWTDGEIFRAIRDTVDKDGKRLSFMALTNVRYLSDEDIHAIIAFLRSQDAVEKETLNPADQPTLLAVIMIGANVLADRPLVEGPIAAPEKAPTAEYGQFMITFLDCTGCHGDDLSGGTSSFSPKGPSLRLVKGWTQEQFITTLRTGVDPSGHQLSRLMPWRSTGRLDDVELAALYEYITSLP